MKLLSLQTIQRRDIGWGKRLRPVDEARAQLIAQNVREVG